ncbi:acetyltransferase [Aquicella lusitana]|uniref:Sugar O-acyltransferase (Sialic acid O-acetyltransferase NeuD family) n=1 Tax=Aquicella lusitana TaxID=254246 RepID=A0A370GX90_9COXI|nr:acetyltransferase [Aquicella lusitana]RDI48171.1 sugar O-acyltransferase (sialic acid O-acetyltransferase NeuD family) [Aquicella lusitana]VVC72813.1 UDP-N-acetylbacillosamine N-acetyltransferase [Aquicella lusitana]
MSKPIIIFGAGQIAELAHYYFTNDSDKKVAAFTIDKEYIKDTSLLELPVIAFEDVVDVYPPSEFDCFVALAYSSLNLTRMKKVNEAKQRGYTLSRYISSRATVLIDPSNIGENCFILEDNTIQPFTKIGNNVTLWSGNHVGHHSIIDDHCFISSHVVICGNVHIEEKCFLGVNSTIRDGITIGASSIVGAAAWVNKTIPANSVCIPQPSKTRNRQARGLL